MYCKQERTFCETAVLNSFLEFLTTKRTLKILIGKEKIGPSRKMTSNREVALFQITTLSRFFFFYWLKSPSWCSAVGELGRQSAFQWSTTAAFSSLGLSEPSCSGFLPSLALLLVNPGPGGVCVCSYLHQRLNAILPAKCYGIFASRIWNLFYLRIEMFIVGEVIIKSPEIYWI